MEPVTQTDKIESIKSFQSTIRKLEKAFVQMTEKGAKTTLVKKRLSAITIGQAVLEHVWDAKPLQYTQEQLQEARKVLTDLLPTIEKTYTKLKEGRPQRTLLDRRIKSLELAIQAIHDLTNE